MDIENEIAKCNKKLDLLQLNLQKVLKAIAQPDYEKSVPENVQIANREKVGNISSSSIYI